jgi:predicted NBD/HSP70 family sugar kinase
MQAFRNGEKDASFVVSEAADYLARAIAAAATLAAPSRIVLGGGVMRENKSFLQLIERRSRAFIFPPFRAQGIDFQLSRLKEDVVCRGAALLCLQKLEVNLDI